MRDLKVIVKQPGKLPETIVITDELAAFQRIVGGYIQAVAFNDDHLMIVHEEGKLIGLTPNFMFRNDVIVGPAIFVGVDQEDFADCTLTEEDVMRLIF